MSPQAADPISADLLADEIAESLTALYTDAGEQPPAFDRATLLRVADDLLADADAGEDDGDGGFVSNAELLDEFAEWSPYTNPKDGRQGAKSGGGRVVYGAAAQKALGAKVESGGGAGGGTGGGGGEKPKAKPASTEWAPPKGTLYSGVPNAGNNKPIHDTDHARSMVDRLNKYERAWVDHEIKNPSANEAELHRAGMSASGLTGDGLGTARGYAGKKVTSKPGVLFPETPAAAKATPPPAKPTAKPTMPPADVAAVYARSGTTARTSEINAAVKSAAAMTKPQATEALKTMGFKPIAGNDPRRQLAKEIVGRRETQKKLLESSGSRKELAAFAKIDDEPLVDVNTLIPSPPARKPATAKPATAKPATAPSPPVHDTLDKLNYFMPQGSTGLADLELARVRQRDYNANVISAAKSREDFAAVTATAKQTIDDAANKNRFARITIPQLSEALKSKYPDLTIPQLHGVLSNLADAKQIHMMPWTLPRREIPAEHVKFVLPKDLETKFYLDKRTAQ